MLSSSRFSLFILVASLPLAACSKPAASGAAPGGPPPALPVKLVAAVASDIPVMVETIARAEGAREMEVRARVQGILEKRVFDEGQKVKAGQALFEIERAPYEVALTQAKAQLAQAKAQQAQAESAKTRAASDLAQAKREYDRLRGLLADKAVSQREADAAETAQNTAASAVASAQAGLASAQAAQAAAEAQIKAAELNLSYCTVTAPVDGTTGRAVKSEGALVSPADGLLTTLAQTDPIWVRFSLSNADLARIQGDPAQAIQKMEVTLPSGAAYPLPGKLNFSASTVDPTLDTLTLRAEFPNHERAILPGQFLRIKAQVGVKKSVFLLPQEAVLTLPQVGQAVFVMAPGESGAMVAQLRPVKAGLWAGDQWIIEPGEGTALKAGDQVITNQLSKIGFMMQMGGGKPVPVMDAATLAPAAPAAGAPAKAETAKGAEGGAK